MTTKVMVRERVATTSKDSYAWLKSRAKRGANRDGGGKVKKPQSWVYACNAVKGICPMKEHPRIRCAVHGTYDEAMKCIAKSMAAKAAGEIE